MSIAAALFSTLVARDTCNYIQVAQGDGCWALAQRCGISQDDLTTYNPPPFSCDTIQVNDYVCCSSGSLPDFSPQQQSNGNCASYTVQQDDTCSSIAAAHSIKDWHKIENVNNQTWAWAGCSLIQVGQNICLSEGIPPFPAPVENTVCGPQKPGTTQPDGMSPEDWASLNPCPLNACCDVWGQCGISDDFCTPTPADTGAPGTAKPNTNGCISNCGTDITNNPGRSGDIKRVGYFEAWNFNRPCLHMDVKDVNTDYYTHVHFGFGNLSSDWQVDVSGAGTEFDNFAKLPKVKKILSFGGWAFSTEPGTYSIFRDGVRPENREAFSNNVVQFIKDAKLDGVDFDWEYPGAQDIPGIPPDDNAYSGLNYLEFLRLVRAKLDPGQSVSIAAPASYWYLKPFPIKDISEVVDYIIYMTYDLHGQWDYNNKFVDPGCPGGNCLRHQVNETEVKDALAMVTKAGVNANKIVIGMPTYGRSFKMTQPGCVFPECTYEGPESAAAKGRCTDTAGYISNSEIFEIINNAQSSGQKILQYYDSGDILVYDDTEWVSWMTPQTYYARQAFTDALGFAGTSDWAIDLNGTIDDTSGPSTSDPNDDSDDGFDPEDWQPCDLTLTFSSLDDLSGRAGGFRSDCVDIYTMQVLMDMLQKASDDYNNVNNGYDEMFGYYVTYMKKLVPQVAAQAFIFNYSTTGQYASIPEVGFGMNYFDCVGGKNADHHYACKDLDKNFQEAAYYTTAMTISDHDGYLGGLAAAGLDPDWIVLGDHEEDRDVSMPHGGRRFKYKFTGFPVENPDMQVPNPKDIVTKGLGSIPDLQNQMMATYYDMIMGQWMDGSTSDSLQAYSAPVFMLMQGVDSMQQAKDLGKKEEQEEEEEAKRKKNFILLIVSVVLMFVPVVGEELALAAGFATLARAIAIAGEVGNAALGIYDTVEDPKSAVVNILGMLLGVGAIAKAARDGKGIGDVAKIKRGMSGDAIANLGKIFKDNDDKLQGIAKMCKVL